jgi:hypothetical protein
MSRPAAITSFAMLLGWIGIYFAYQDSWLGVILALGTTAGGFLAIRRGKLMAQQRKDRLEGAISAAAARNRELELLRRLGSILLGVRSSGELLEEAVQLPRGRRFCSSWRRADSFGSPPARGCFAEPKGASSRWSGRSPAGRCSTIRR